MSESVTEQLRQLDLLLYRMKCDADETADEYRKQSKGVEHAIYQGVSIGLAHAALELAKVLVQLSTEETIAKAAAAQASAVQASTRTGKSYFPEELEQYLAEQARKEKGSFEVVHTRPVQKPFSEKVQAVIDLLDKARYSPKLDGKFHGLIRRDDTLDLVPPTEYVVFMAYDDMLPLMLEDYYRRCLEISCEKEHLAKIRELQQRVKVWRRNNVNRCKKPGSKPKQAEQIPTPEPRWREPTPGEKCEVQQLGDEQWFKGLMLRRDDKGWFVVMRDGHSSETHWKFARTPAT